VLVFFGGGWLILIGVVVKMAQSGVKNDLTNLGSKVDKSDKENERKFARLEAAVDANDEKMNGLSRDVMTAVAASSAEFTRALSEMQVEMARMQERDKLATSLDRFKLELRDEIRRSASGGKGEHHAR
jgi:hypothetical protein